MKSRPSTYWDLTECILKTTTDGVHGDRKADAKTYPKSKACMMTSGRLIFNLQNLVCHFNSKRIRWKGFQKWKEAVMAYCDE
jgi:hypothetical protein